MQIEKSPFLKLESQTVVGFLKTAGSRDPDVLHTQKANLISAGKFPKLAGVYLMVLGGIMTVTIIMSFIGIPVLILGWWMRRRGIQNLEAIEIGWREFTGEAALEAGIA